MVSDQVLVIEKPRHAAIQTESAKPVNEGTFRAQTLYSGLSAGTELSFFKGTNPFLKARWDTELGLFRPDASTGYPVRKLGYMQVAQVIESAAPSVPTGSTVAMTYGHRTGYLGDPLVDRVIPLPVGLDPMLGVYVAHMGPICANGLLHAAVEQHGTDVRTLADGVRGMRVAVTGAGVIGLLTALFARHNGASEVVVLDPDNRRRAVAEAIGLIAIDPETADPAVALKTRWRHAVADRGADVVFQCRGQAASLALALRLLRPQGAVIDLAFYPGGAPEVRLGEEFHHNGLTIRCAQIGRVPRGTAHTWDRERLSRETIDLLRAEGQTIIEHLITDVLPLANAPTLFEELSERRCHTMQTIFTC